MIPFHAVSEKSIVVAGESMVARADGSLLWERRSTLFVADVHLGKAATFRSHAVPIPVGTTASTLDRLGCALHTTRARRLIVLGDLWHAKEGRRNEIFASLRSWRESFSSVEVTLVEGNHDRRSGVMPDGLAITVVEEPFVDGPFALCHYPCKLDGAYCLAGHIHPSVSLRAGARQRLNLPCFWFSDCCGVLPAFGDFTGTARIEPAAGDQVVVIADGELHTVGFVPTG